MVTLVNRAKMSTSTTGTGTITLGSAETGYQSFADAGVANGDVVRYVIEDGDDWEIGSGTYTATGTTLTRTVDESSNADAALNLTGSAVVFITAAAEDVAGADRGLDLDDNARLRLGDSNDLQIYHDGTYDWIRSSGVQFRLASDEFQFYKGNTFENLAKFNADSDVELYYDNSLKFETTTSGIKVTGTVDVNGAYTLPTSDGTNGQVLTTDGAGAVTFATPSGGGTPDLFAENYDGTSTKPTATGTNAVAIGELSTASPDRGMAFGYSAVASGTQSTAVGRGASAGGTLASAFGYAATTAASQAVAIGQSYSAGQDSLAAIIDSNSSSYGATGAYSVAIGRRNKATTNTAASIGGYTNTSSAAYSSTLGGYGNTASTDYATVAGGYFNVASGVGSFAHGLRANAEEYGKKAYASGYFAATGDAQGGSFVLRSDTTDATAEALTTNNSTAGTTNQIILPNNSAYSFSGTIVARESATDGTDCAAWEVKGLIRREGSAGTTVLVNSATTVIDNTPSWGMALSADTTNGGLAITVTGAAATNIRWVATIHTSEVIYA